MGTAPRKVALLIETSNAYARGLLRGIGSYARQPARPWRIRFVSPPAGSPTSRPRRIPEWRRPSGTSPPDRRPDGIPPPGVPQRGLPEGSGPAPQPVPPGRPRPARRPL